MSRAAVIARLQPPSDASQSHKRRSPSGYRSETHSMSDMRSRIAWPIKTALRETNPEPATLERMWVEVDRRSRSHGNARAWRPLITAALACLILFTVWTGFRQSVLVERGRVQIGTLEPSAGAVDRQEVVLESGSRIAV